MMMTAEIGVLQLQPRKKRITGKHQKLEETRKDAPLRVSKTARPYPPLNFGLLVSQTVGDKFLLF